MGKSSEIFNESGETQEKVFRSLQGQDISNVESGEAALQAGISEELGDSGDQILVDSIKEGIRIQIVDKEGSLMFEQGKNKLTSKGREILRVVGSKIKDMQNKVSIEGHTDSLPFSKKDYSNWELSTDRASKARIELQKAGLDPKRINKVSGFADTLPLIKDDPANPRNRRISIILHTLPPKVEEKIATALPPKYTLDNPAVGKLKLLPDEVQKTPVQKPSASENIIEEKQRPVVSGNNNKPVIDDEWTPVIKDDTEKLVIDKGWIPVIERPGGMPEDDEVTASTGPAIEEEGPRQIIIDDIDDVQKLPSIKLYGTGGRKKNSTRIKDLMNPVITDNEMIK